MHVRLAVNVSSSWVSVWWVVWAGRNDDVEVLAIELLAPDEGRAVLLGALVDDGVGVLGDNRNLDRLGLWMLLCCQL